MANDFMEMAADICKKYEEGKRLCLLSDSDPQKLRLEYRMGIFNSFTLVDIKKIARVYGYEVSSWFCMGAWQPDEFSLALYFLRKPEVNGDWEL